MPPKGLVDSVSGWSPGDRSSATPRRGWRRRIVASLVTAALVTTALVAATSPAQAAIVEVGYRDFSYGTVATTPTGEKPESKLWYTADNIWWGSLFNKLSGHFEIYRFDGSQQSWSTTGVSIDSRAVTEADALYDKVSNKLYVVTHVKDTATSSDMTMKFEQYTYASGLWTLDSGFPINVSSSNPETAVLDRDSTGMVWITWTEPNGAGGRRVEIAHSTTDTQHWSAPYDLPGTTHANNLRTDEIATVIAYRQNIGVMWGNEADGTLNFDSHQDGAADTDWASAVLCDNTTFGRPGCPDDHFNIKSLGDDGTGRVFALVKTGLDGGPSPVASDPLEIMWEFNPSLPDAGWSHSTVWTVGDNTTRAITLLDASNHEIYAFASPCCNGGTVYMKKSDYSTDIRQWEPGLGTPFMRSSTDVNINNVTSTKQSVNDDTGLLVLASASKTKFYLHNFIQLGSADDTTPPTVTAESPTAGATSVSADTTVTATFSEAVDPTTVTDTSFTLTDPGLAPVSATVTYDAVSHVATLAPSSNLSPGVTYTATVSGVNDTAGNAMVGPTIWSFTTVSSAGITNLGQIANASSSTSGLTLSMTTTSAVPAGSRIVLGIGYAGASTITAQVTDSAGDAWTVDKRTANGSTGTTSAIASTRTAGGLVSGATITLTLSARANMRLAVGYAYSGISGIGATAGSAARSKTPTSGVVSTGVGNLIFGVTMYNSGTATHTAGAGNTELAEIAAGTKKLAVDQQVVLAVGDHADSGTLSASLQWTDSAVAYT